MFMLDIVDFYQGALVGLVALVVIGFFGAVLSSHRSLWDFRPSSHDHAKKEDDNEDLLS